MNTFLIIALALYVGGILGYLLNIWCPTEGRDNGMQVALDTAIWPVLGAVLVVLYFWLRRHPDRPTP